MTSHDKKREEAKDLQLNSDLQGVDKAPGEESGKKEKVTHRDLKDKKVDGDPAKKSDQPAR